MNAVHDVDVPLLRAFDALLRERHLTRAAQSLQLTQSALSHALSRMRVLWGDELFLRAPMGMLPTARALELGPRVRESLGMLAALTAPAGRFEPVTLRRTFRMLAGDFWEASLLPQLCALLMKQAPLVDVDVSAQASTALERFDLAIGVFPQPAPHWVITPLFNDPFVSIVRKSHPALRGGMTLPKFAKLGHVLVAPGGLYGGPVDTALAARGLQRRVAVKVASFLAASLLVAKTDYVVTLPRSIAELNSRGLAVTLMEPPLALPESRITMAHHVLHAKDQAHMWFRSMIRDLARK